MAIKIVLDAGHGGYDNGATYNQRKEKDDVLNLTLAVGKLLSDAGYDVVYTRTSDVYDSPSEKAAIANASGADYFVSFHRNSSPNPNTYSGVETLVYDDSGIKAEMARNVNSELENAGFNNLGVTERPNLTVLRRTNMPAILIEAGFINTDADNATFDNNFNQIAAAIAKGIEETVGTPTKRNVYRVQTGLYRRYGNAQYQLDSLLEKGIDARIEKKGEYYAVLAGTTYSLEDAKALENQLINLGYDTLIIQET